jgi:hypothetical protein
MIVEAPGIETAPNEATRTLRGDSRQFDEETSDGTDVSSTRNAANAREVVQKVDHTGDDAEASHGAVDEALVEALRAATHAGRWEVVAQIARALEARRR